MARTVLIVDDDPDARYIYQTLVRSFGYEAAVAGRATGLVAARGLRPDLILMDVAAPTLEGFTGIERLRDDPATATVPVVIMSIFDLPTDAAVEAGAAEYLSKPFSPEALRQAIVRHAGPPVPAG